MPESESPSSPHLRHRRKLIAIAAGITVYGLLGFLVLPWVAERQLVAITQERLSLSTTVESIYFNPFTFYLAIDQLVIEDGGSSLVNLSHLHSNLQASRFLLFKAQLAELVIDDLELELRRTSDSENTLTDLAQRWAESSSSNTSEVDTAEAEESSDLFPVEVITASLSNIDINFVDASLATQFNSMVTIKSIQIDGLSTLEDAIGQHSIEIEFEQDGELNVGGEFSINPLRFSGNLALQKFPLPMISRYGQDSLPATIESGQVAVTIDYDADLSASIPDIHLDNVSAALDTLVILENGIQEPFVELGQLALNSGAIRLPENTVALQGLSLESLSVLTDINSDKEINLARLVSALSAPPQTAITSDQGAIPESAPDNNGDTAPWQIELDRFDVLQASLSFRDESIEQAFSVSTDINGNIRNISNAPNRRLPVDFQLALNTGGTVALQGEVAVLPTVDLDIDINVADIDLVAAQPYINEFAFVGLEQGKLNGSSKLASNPSEPLQISSSLAVSDFSAIDSQLEETLVAFEELAIDAATYSASANAVEISEVTLESLFARVIINEDGSSNIGRSLKPSASAGDDASSETAAVSADEPTESQPMAITVGQVRVNNGSANFTDKDLPLVFNANITNLSGLAEGFASNSNQATNISLEGEVDDYGLVQINSALKPFALTEQTILDVAFTNIQMPAMTPYIIKFAGREILEGSIDLALNYDVSDGSLEANNQLVLSDLKLGGRVEQPDAMDLPLDLALALLKDSNGVIDLEVPIAGDVNDPEFDFGPAIRRALRNVLTNIVAAPFRLLSGLVGSSDTELDHIRFLPGRTDIAAPERQILVQLSEALKLRPQLALEISPVASPADPLALKTAAVNARIDEALSLTEDSAESLTNRRREVLEQLYINGATTPTLSDIALGHQQAAQEGQAPVLDVIAYNADLVQKLIGLETLSSDALENLAQTRANAASAFLIDEGEVSATQIRLVEASESELDDSGWLTMSFELTSTE